MSVTDINRNKPVDDKLLLTPSEYLAALDNAMGRNSLYGLIQTKKIKHVRIGRKILIPKSEVTDFPLREAEVA